MFHFVKQHTTLQIKANNSLPGCLPLSGRLVESPGSAGGSKQSSKRLTLLRSSISSRRRYFTWLDSRGLGCPFTAKQQLDNLKTVVNIQFKMTKKNSNSYLLVASSSFVEFKVTKFSPHRLNSF